MKTLKLILFAFAVVFSLNACTIDIHLDGDEKHPNNNEEYENTDDKEYDNPDNTEELKDFVVGDEVVMMMEENHNITYDEIQDKIKNNPNVESYRLEDSILYIALKDSMELQIDLYGITHQQYDEEEYTEDDGETMMEEIQNALDRLEEDDFGEDGYANQASRRISVGKEGYRNNNSMPSRETSTNSTKRIISNNKVLFWAPNGAAPYKLLRRLQNFVNNHGLRLQTKIGNACTIEDLSTFSSYGLVVIENHGNPLGRLQMPETEYWKEKYAENKDNFAQKNGEDNGVRGKIIGFDHSTGNELFKEITYSPRFPELKHTIIWTCVCYAFNKNKKSDIMNAAVNADAAAFFGADNIVSYSIAMNYMDKLGVMFYNKGKGGAELKKAFAGLPLTTYELSGQKGNYCMINYRNVDVIYQKPVIARGDGKKPVGELYLPSGYNPFRGRRVTSRSKDVSPSEIEAGFSIYNVYRGRKSLIPYSSDDLVQSATWNNTITRFVITGNTDDLEGGDYKYRTYLKFGDEILYSDQEYSFTVEKPLCPDQYHPHSIDLGFGVKFSCCNVGANSPEQYGGYYEWKHAAEAAMNWGSGWRVPSMTEFSLLKSSCSYEWTSLEGVNGMLFKSKNGNSIFMPAAGIQRFYDFHGVGEEGSYWSSEPYSSDSDNGGQFFGFDKDHPITGYGFCYSYTVRPVRQ